MKEITEYQPDGVQFRFKSREECLQYERLDKYVKDLMQPLGNLNEIKAFMPKNKISYYECFIKHDRKLLLEIKRNLFKCLIGILGREQYQSLINEDTDDYWANPYNVASYIIESGEDKRYKPVLEALWRLSSIDEYFREWVSYRTPVPLIAKQYIIVECSSNGKESYVLHSNNYEDYL